MATSQERRNERARALGYKNDYERRIASGKARGLSRSQSRGHSIKGEKTAYEVSMKRGPQKGGDMPRRYMDYVKSFGRKERIKILNRWEKKNHIKLSRADWSEALGSPRVKK